MKSQIPEWAMQTAVPDDYNRAVTAHKQGTLQIIWPTDMSTVRNWAKGQTWPTPWFNFQSKFITHMLASPQAFTRVLQESGIVIHLPRQEYTLSAEKIEAFDALYDEQSPEGFHSGWRLLVEELREIRRAVEAGVVIHIDGGEPLNSWQSFYNWAHGRYYLLEEGADEWIGHH
jgi:hypothetical protein